MKKIRDLLSRPLVTVLLFVLAASLLAGSTITGTRAVLNQFSNDYDAEMDLQTIGIALLENGTEKAGADALLDPTEFLAGDDDVKPGKTYDEILAVKNTATIPVFTRVTIYKYWLEKDGKTKAYDKDPSLIELGLANKGAWVQDLDAPSTKDERTVLYYTSTLDVGETSPAFVESITINGDIIRMVHQDSKTEGGRTTITNTYAYDGYSFCIKVSVDAVQTHNGEAAIRSAWGRSVSVSGGSLSIG